MAQIQMKEERDNQQLQNREEQTMHYCIDTTPNHMGKARNRRHKSMFYGPLPTLHIDDIGHTIKGDAQIGPDRSTDHQDQSQILHLFRGERTPSKFLRSHTDE